MNAVTVHDQPWHLAILDKDGRAAAEILSQSGMIPPAFAGKPQQIQLAIAMGARVGLDWLASLNGICVINNRATIWGDAMLAICRNCSAWEDMEETQEGEGDKFVATCTVKRKGQTPIRRTFSMVDAIVGGYAKKQGPWQTNPKRMCQMRARGFSLRDAFADVMMGFPVAEEMRDVEGEVTGTEIGNGVDLTQAAPAAKVRGKGNAKDIETTGTVSTEALTGAAKPAASDEKIPGNERPTGGDNQPAVNTTAATTNEIPKSDPPKDPPPPARHTRQEAKDLIAETFKVEALRPALHATTTRMGGKKLAEITDEQCHDFHVILTEEIAKMKAVKS